MRKYSSTIALNFSHMTNIIQFPRAGYVDQDIDVEDMGGGMIVIDPLLDEWLDCLDYEDAA